jgi:hypothetical protein
MGLSQGRRDTLTGRALLPKPTIGPPQIEQICTGIARGPLKEAGREARLRGGLPPNSMRDKQ